MLNRFEFADVLDSTCYTCLDGGKIDNSPMKQLLEDRKILNPDEGQVLDAFLETCDDCFESGDLRLAEITERLSCGYRTWPDLK